MKNTLIILFGVAILLNSANVYSQEAESGKEAYRGDGDLIFLRDFGSDDVGYLAVPKDRPDYGIVLVHGWTGLSEGVRRDCDYLAEEANITLAVDLFNGAKPTNDREARVERGKLQQELVVTAIRTGARFFQNSPRFQMDRVVVVAHQQSALAALKAAQKQTNIMAVVLIDPEPALTVEQLVASPVPVRVFISSEAGIERYLQLDKSAQSEEAAEAAFTQLPPSIAPLVVPISPVWINSWRNRRMNPELWATIKEFLQPLEVRTAPLTKRLINSVF